LHCYPTDSDSLRPLIHSDQVVLEEQADYRGSESVQLRLASGILGIVGLFGASIVLASYLSRRAKVWIAVAVVIAAAIGMLLLVMAEK
jgi:hypothetical protein